MAIVSALAVASARIWWLIAYWTPRARTFRRRNRALELGVEWQHARECPADDAWRQQVEQDIATSGVTVPMTAELLVAAVGKGVPGSRRWRRRHVRAMSRMRSDRPGSDVSPVSRALVGSRRQALARAIPVVAALCLGVVLGPTLQHAATHSHRAAAQAAAAEEFQYHCSHCLPEERAGGFVSAQGQTVPVFADPIRATWVPTFVLTGERTKDATRWPLSPR